MIIVIYGFLILIGLIGITFIAGGAGFYRMMDGLNTTIYNMNDSTITSEWNKHLGFMNNIYWITPVIMIAGIILVMWLVAQRREYYTSGGVY